MYTTGYSTERASLTLRSKMKRWAYHCSSDGLKWICGVFLEESDLDIQLTHIEVTANVAQDDQWQAPFFGGNARARIVYASPLLLQVHRPLADGGDSHCRRCHPPSITQYEREMPAGSLMRPWLRPRIGERNSAAVEGRPSPMKSGGRRSKRDKERGRVSGASPPGDPVGPDGDHGLK